MRRFATLTLLFVLGSTAVRAAAPGAPPAPAPPAPAAPAPEGVEFFEKHVRPLLVDHCYKCHSAQSEKLKGGLYVDSRYGLMKGGKTGPAVVPGEPDKSLLIKAVRYQDEDLAMPPKQALAKEQVALLEQWVRTGAPDPRGDAPAGTRAEPTVLSLAGAKEFWSFKRPVAPAPPQAAASPIDSFIVAKLNEKGLKPAPAADRPTLIRRLSFDLTGLPPAADEVAAFVNDPSPNALPALVDRLLASPRFGERWARHWLDLARYADTKGYVFQEERRYPYAYTYRDWVVRAFNEDLPYDRFLTYQIAADRVVVEKPEPDNRNLAAMGFLTVGRRFLNNQADIIDDRIDVIFRGTMALTVACARCHDHKYDPIPTADYYSLYGVLASSVEPGPADAPVLASDAPPDKRAEFEKELAKRQAAIDAFRKEKGEGKLNRADRNKLDELTRKRDELLATHPAAPARAMVMKDAPQPVNPVIFKRGNPAMPGNPIPRQFLACVAGDGRQPFRNGSGRLELARAIASKDNPLTARVYVNRVWALLFGRGIVRTPSDFGVRGDRPTHPELLDYLAAKFVEDGWSTKRLIRAIVLSAAYRQSSTASADALAADPDNRMLARQNRKRLDFEALRDSLLFAGAGLDETLGGRPVDLLAQPFPRRRTIYGFVDRQNLPGMFRAFDFASPDSHTPMRFANTVPQQALFMMNSPFVVEQARALAKKAGDGPAEQRVKAMYRAALSRDPAADELAMGVQFVQAEPAPASPQHKGAAPALSPWEKYAQVLLLTNEFVFVD